LTKKFIPVYTKPVVVVASASNESASNESVEDDTVSTKTPTNTESIDLSPANAPKYPPSPSTAKETSDKEETTPLPTDQTTTSGCYLLYDTDSW